MKKYIYIVILIIAGVAPNRLVYSQPIEEELNQEQWEAVRDFYAVEAIKLLARKDTLGLQIDSLKLAREKIENFDCEAELYALVGANREQVNNFRRKFDETEKKINSKIGTPDETRKMYFDEITASKIRCLPEFSDRYISMKEKMSAWSPTIVTEKLPEGTYEVVKGDCLWEISRTKYSTPYLWPVIWDANKISIVNSQSFIETEYQRISNPNLIYPEQILKIPSVSPDQKKEAEDKSKYYRRLRKSKDN